MKTTVTRTFVHAHGLRFHCALQGEGPLVLLLHGFPERWFSWRQQLPALASLGFRVVAPDLRGYGDSDRPAAGYDLPTLALDVEGLIDSFGAATATVIGHDWGGAIAWELASRHPARVERFAVINGPHPAVMARMLLRSPAQLARSWYLLFFQLPWLPEWLLGRDHGAAIERIMRPATRDPILLDAYREGASRPGALRAMLAYYRQSGRAAAVPARRRRLLRSYPVISRPGLLLWSEDDPVLGPELVAPHLAYARDLRVVRLPHGGHFLPQTQAGAVNDALRSWLRPG